MVRWIRFFSIGYSEDSVQTKQSPCAMKSNSETGYTAGELVAPVSGRSVVSGRKKVEKPLCTYIIIIVYNNYHYSFSHSPDLSVALQQTEKDRCTVLLYLELFLGIFQPRRSYSDKQHYIKRYFTNFFTTRHT